MGNAGAVLALSTLEKTRKGSAEALLRFQRLLRSFPADSLTVDCGANVGHVTAAMLKAGHRVIAFEPDPMAFSLLQSRFAGNPRVMLHQKAVGSSARKLQLYRTPGANRGIVGQTIGTTLFANSHVEPAEGVFVDVINLPEFLISLPERVALLKLDVEGAEVEILNALLPDKHEHIDNVLVETHERLFPDMAEEIAAHRDFVRRQRLSKFDLDWI